MSADSLFMLVDGHALIYRAYHAFPELTTPTGMLANAIYGFTRILLTSIRDFQPEYIAVAFDHPQPTLRHESFADYKAHRVEMPDDLKPQIAIIKNLVETLNIPQFELAGYEADDLIGTLVTQLEDHVDFQLVNALIVTGDRDLLQLVTERAHVFMPGRSKKQGDREFDPQMVKEVMGVSPLQITDLKSLMGDASDNIPGVRGIGPKTAVQLIQQFTSLEQLYDHLDHDGVLTIKTSLRDKLVNDRANAVLSKSLATINRQAPIQLDLPACRVAGYDKEKAIALFEELGFKSLITLLPADDFELGIQGALF